MRAHAYMHAHARTHTHTHTHFACAQAGSDVLGGNSFQWPGAGSHSNHSGAQPSNVRFGSHAGEHENIGLEGD